MRSRASVEAGAGHTAGAGTILLDQVLRIVFVAQSRFSASEFGLALEKFPLAYCE